VTGQYCREAGHPSAWKICSSPAGHQPGPVAEIGKTKNQFHRSDPSANRGPPAGPRPEGEKPRCQWTGRPFRRWPGRAVPEIGGWLVESGCIVPTFGWSRPRCVHQYRAAPAHDSAERQPHPRCRRVFDLAGQPAAVRPPRGIGREWVRFQNAC